MPEGCYWSPTPKYPNAYTDAAGNRWCNQVRKSDPALDDNRGEGYYDPSGRYHPSQNEIDFAEALNQAITDNHKNGPTYSKPTDEPKEEVKDIIGW